MAISSRSVELINKNTQARINILVLDTSVDPPVPIDATTGPQLDVLDTGDTVVHRDGFPSFTLTGTLSIVAGQAVVLGTNTKFQTEVVPGDSLTFGTETHIVETIISDLQITLTTVHVLGATNAIATKATRIVHPATGQYYLNWGDSNAPTNLTASGQLETSTSRDFFFRWRLTTTVGTEEQTAVQVVRIISARVMGLLPSLRLIIDKIVKNIDENEFDPVFIGYSDWMLVDALIGGLGWINAFQPTIAWRTLDEFPIDYHGRVLIDAAVFHLLTCQEIFAVDADINWSDQGNVLVFDRQPKLTAIAMNTWNRLKETVPPMKRQYVSSGQVYTELGINSRFVGLLQSAPSGTLFRNAFTAGLF